MIVYQESIVKAAVRAALLVGENVVPKEQLAKGLFLYSSGLSLYTNKSVDYFAPS